MRIMASDLTSSLHTYFGFCSFRPGQKEAIQSLIKGNHTLIVMPTGAGKSLIFNSDKTHLELHQIGVEQFLEMLRFEQRSKLEELPVTLR